MKQVALVVALCSVPGFSPAYAAMHAPRRAVRLPSAQALANVAVAQKGDAEACTPGYDPCIAPGPDVDCAGGSGNGPRYVEGPVRVSGSDPYDLDRDGDGVGSE